jgi:hypothetical protein
MSVRLLLTDVKLERVMDALLRVRCVCATKRRVLLIVSMVLGVMRQRVMGRVVLSLRMCECVRSQCRQRTVERSVKGLCGRRQRALLWSVRRSALMVRGLRSRAASLVGMVECAGLRARHAV